MRFTASAIDRTLSTSVWVLLVYVACAPGAALAQVDSRQSTPSVVAAPSVTAAPRHTVQRSMRYRLRSGEVMIGREVGVDAEAITVATSSGVVRIARSNLSSIRPARNQPGRGLIVSGSIVFGTFYVVPLFVAAMVSDEFEPLVLLPIAGPFILAYQCHDVTDLAGFGRRGSLAGACALFATVWGIGQVVGTALFIAGIARGATASDDDDPRVGKIDLWPVIARGYQGLVFYATF